MGESVEFEAWGGGDGEGDHAYCGCADGYFDDDDVAGRMPAGTADSLA